MYVQYNPMTHAYMWFVSYCCHGDGLYSHVIIFRIHFAVVTYMYSVLLGRLWGGGYSTSLLCYMPRPVLHCSKTLASTLVTYIVWAVHTHSLISLGFIVISCVPCFRRSSYAVVLKCMYRY